MGTQDSKAEPSVPMQHKPHKVKKKSDRKPEHPVQHAVHRAYQGKYRLSLQTPQIPTHVSTHRMLQINKSNPQKVDLTTHRICCQHPATKATPGEPKGSLKSRWL